MALRKSHLYSSLWQSCDQLRGGMDASQYKDYILTLLFMKYVSDKYAGTDVRYADIEVPPEGQLRRHGRAQGDQGDRRWNQRRSFAGNSPTPTTTSSRV